MKKEAMLYKPLKNQRVHCLLCAHYCKIARSKSGVCRVRLNEDGQLFSLVYGQVIAANIDPIEKKPLFHFLPGSKSYSIATIGCNFQCRFCQNWQISQALRKKGLVFEDRDFLPDEIVSSARENLCQSISYTYTEPTIFFEYAYDTARLAKEFGLKNVFVTNGYMTREALDTIGSYLDAANVDLKSFNDAYYKRICRARLQPVLDSINYMKELGIWVEVTTLLVPGENDSDEELTQIAQFIASVNTSIPWHINQFHPEYEYLNHQPTSIESMRRAQEIGWENGLLYVYLGNIAEGISTECPHCSEQLIERLYLGAETFNIRSGRCPKCGTAIPGVWS